MKISRRNFLAVAGAASAAAALTAGRRNSFCLQHGNKKGQTFESVKGYPERCV